MILISELTKYIGLIDKSFISGIQKTIIYLIIFLGFLISLSKKHYRVDKIGKIFAFFTTITIISTSFGVQPDIKLWRQIIHLLLYISVFYSFYIAINILGFEEVIVYIKLLYLSIILTYLLALAKGYSAEGNVVYYLFMFLPVTDFFGSKKSKYFLYFLQIFAMLISNKRTGLIAIIIYFLCYDWLSNKKISTKKRIYKAIFYILIAASAYFLYPLLLEKLNITVFDELAISNISEDGGSNRLFIYNQLLQKQFTKGLLHWIIGSGYNSVLLSRICTDGPVGGFVSAHNDFLEVVYDYGLIGITLYLHFFILLFKKGIEMLKNNYKFSIPFFGSLLLTVIMSFTSHLIIYLNYYAVMIIFWAICVADFNAIIMKEKKDNV